ncbi:cytochrome b [Collimonas sp.]|jgi:cytochrome b561|uniref:cytochrome b n=1 Tax=Collimonas sp. TaxID=1963772 RepID=UPI002C791AEB|nr:cytochrome b/b6 domain-containing protein [Collimonas sp.]HWW03658.1 cytochrome b/b6 domain-containing protein [Collimonas sp.]
MFHIFLEKMQTIKTPVYSAPAKVFHWLTVLLLAIQYSIGWLMPDIGRDTQPIGLISWHLSIGALIVLLVLLRLLWRWTHPAPPVPQMLSPLLNMIARTTHWLLYFLLIAFPLMGWANASSRGWSVSLFGVVPLPPLSSKGSQLGHTLGDMHQLFVWVLIAVVALHVAAALYHHFIVKDDTMRRMLPGG